MAESKESIVVFPFMGQGHIIPFLALALQIEQRHNKKYNIIFINTSKNIKQIRSSLPSNSSITLHEIPFNCSSFGLPSNSENFDALPYDLVIQFLRASTSLKPAFKELIADLVNTNHGQPPLLIISDIFFGWACKVAKEFNIFHAIFSGAGGYGMACYFSIWANLPHRKVDSDEFMLPDFEEASKFHKSQLALNMLEADGTDPWSLFQSENFSGWVNSDGILFNTVEEFDQIGLKYFKRKLGLSVWPIGPILLSSEARTGKEGGISNEFCNKWLDEKEENSVLFVSFGSMNTISSSQMMQLAMALEGSGKNFIWAVRPPIGFDINSEFRANEWLPQGFEERALDSKRGLLVKKWAPQLEILSHKSTSAFLSHCGWNSVLEALIHGVPILGWPMAGEQFFNAKFLQEMGVCVEVARGKICEVKHEDIVAKIASVMDDEAKKGKEIRRKIYEVREMIKNAMKDEEEGYKGSSVKAMVDFFNAAISMKKNKSKVTM